MSVYLAQLDYSNSDPEYAEFLIEYGYFTCDYLDVGNPYDMAIGHLDAATELGTVEEQLQTLMDHATRYVAVAHEGSLCPRNQESAAIVTSLLFDVLQELTDAVREMATDS